MAMLPAEILLQVLKYCINNLVEEIPILTAEECDYLKRDDWVRPGIHDRAQFVQATVRNLSLALPGWHQRIQDVMLNARGKYATEYYKCRQRFWKFRCERRALLPPRSIWDEWEPREDVLTEEENVALKTSELKFQLIDRMYKGVDFRPLSASTKGDCGCTRMIKSESMFSSRNSRMTSYRQD